MKKLAILASLFVLAGCAEYTNRVISHGGNRYCNLPKLQRDYVYARAKQKLEEKGIKIGTQILCPQDQIVVIGSEGSD